MTNKDNSWFKRNDWSRPLIVSVILILTPLWASTFLDGSGVAPPGWAVIVSSAGACLGLFIAALKARLTDTISARAFCYVAVAFCYAVILWRLIEALKH